MVDTAQVSGRTQWWQLRKLKSSDPSHGPQKIVTIKVGWQSQVQLADEYESASRTASNA
jgi:hypothetical protein